MSKARDLADFISTGSILSDGTIESTEINGVTADASELNVLDGITVTTEELNNVAGISTSVQTQLDGKQDVVAGVSDTEIGYLDGVTSNLQTQLDNISVTSGSLTKSFTSGETASITLAQAISPAPVVSVTKEVPQTGISSKGAWDVATDGANYERHDTAYDTTLTPSTVLDLAAGSYDSVTFYVGTQEGAPKELFFKPDGTKMYIIGSQGADINEYNLSTAWDIDTSSYSQNFSVASQETLPNGLTFKTDGTKFYITGQSTDAVHEYSLSTAWDVSTASFTQTKSIATEQGLPTNVEFKDDGTKMYVCGRVPAEVHQYTLSTAWDVSTASYDSVTLDPEGTTPQSIRFHNSGSTLIVLDESSPDGAYQYSLSTAWDLSTASYTSKSLDMSSEDSNPEGLFIKPDGSKIYMVAPGTDTVRQYSVGSSALVLGSGSFASTDVGKQIEGNGGKAILTATDGSYSEVTAFNDSSTIASGDWGMFATTFDAANGVRLSEYNTGGFYLGSASYDSVSFSITSQDDTANDLTFNNDGTRMFIIGEGNTAIYQYDLSTAFDISTAVFDHQFTLPSYFQTNQRYPHGIAFNSTGTYMYICGASDSYAHRFTLSTAFDISSNPQSWDSFDAPWNSDPRAIAVSNDDTQLYMLDDGSNNYVVQYNMSGAFNGSSPVGSFSLSNETNGPNGIAFNSDGTKMFIVDDSENIFQYTLSTAFTVSTASYDNVTFSVSSEASYSMGIAFNTVGDKMFVLDRGADDVHQYTTRNIGQPTSQYHIAITNSSGQIATNFWTDLNSMTADQAANDGTVHYAVSTDDRTTWSVIKEGSGVRPIVRDNSGTWQYNTAVDSVFDITAGSYTGNSYSTSAQDGQQYNIAVSSDGTRFYSLGTNSDDIFQYDMSTPFDITTASFTSGQNIDLSAQVSDVRDIKFSTDGTKLYALNASTDVVFQYNLSTAWDVTTATYSNNSLSLVAVSTTAYCSFFKSDGTKFYFGSSSDRVLYQYTLSTAWDISSATYDSVSFDVSSQISTLVAFSINPNGTELYALDGTGTSNIYKYTLSTGWSLSTASYSGVSNTSLTRDTGDMHIDYTQGKMYGMDSETVPEFSGFNVESYTTSTTWANSTTNDEFYALQQALGYNAFNRMDKTQLDAVTDPNHYTLGDTLDLMIGLYLPSNGTSPTSDGVSINYDAEALNQGAVLGTDYDYDFPDSTTVRVTSNAAQNLKIRVV